MVINPGKWEGKEGRKGEEEGGGRRRRGKKGEGKGKRAGRGYKPGGERKGTGGGVGDGGGGGEGEGEEEKKEQILITHLQGMRISMEKLKTSPKVTQVLSSRACFNYIRCNFSSTLKP